jgi:glycine oxidase
LSAREPYSPSPTVAVIGAGVIGLAIARRLAQRGAKVSVFDKGAAGSGASHAAAGMLAAHLEAEPREENLVTLNRASQQMWPAFAAELEAASGMSVDMRTEGTLLLALTGDDQSRLKHVLAFQKSLGLPLEWLTATEARRREPHLTPTISGAIFSPQDHQVDNRLVAAALRAAVLKAGVILHENTPVERTLTSDTRVTGVVAGGKTVPADIVVLAAGAWSRGIAGLPAAS